MIVCLFTNITGAADGWVKAHLVVAGKVGVNGYIYGMMRAQRVAQRVSATLRSCAQAGQYGDMVAWLSQGGQDLLVWYMSFGTIGSKGKVQN
jgi:hypothetical protein